MWYVYILKCNDDTYYTRCTNNLDERLKRHSKGEVHYTKDKLPVQLITFIAFSDKYKAYDFEKCLKSGSGMAFRNKKDWCEIVNGQSDSKTTHICAQIVYSS